MREMVSGSRPGIDDEGVVDGWKEDQLLCGAKPFATYDMSENFPALKTEGLNIPSFSQGGSK